jgi:RNA-directed DNA polymerase
LAELREGGFLPLPGCKRDNRNAISLIRCGLFFQDGDLMEIDHLVPRSKGGKDNYDNLQLLHGHCHDAKTAADKVAVVVREINEDYLNLNPF